MSTRSTIIVKVDDEYHGIYCHFDGYPSNMGPLLLKYYDTQKEAEELVALGGLSYLAPRLKPKSGEQHTFNSPNHDITLAYHRDRGEPWEQNKPEVHYDINKIDFQEYVYVFKDDDWYLYDDGEFALLKEVYRNKEH